MIDWNEIAKSLIAATPPTLAVIVTWWSIMKANKATHVLINSRMDELVSAEKEVSRKEGEETGRAEGKAS